jgi:hypothetical protein
VTRDTISMDETSARLAGGMARRPRRAMLAGAAGALGVVAAETLARATPAQATQGAAVLEGQDNTGATSRTGVFTTGNTEFGILADPNTSGKGSLGVYGHGKDVGVLGNAATAGNGTGVHGFGSGSGSGVAGHGGRTNAAGVLGTGGGDAGVGVFGRGSGSGHGVVGHGGHLGIGGDGVSGTGGDAGGAGVSGIGARGGPGKGGPGIIGFGTGGNPGVIGETSGPNSNGVEGGGAGKGDGVLGFATVGNGVHGQVVDPKGVGVLAENTAGGTALQATGPTIFSRSGVLTVGAGKSAVTKTGVSLTAASLVLATLQQNRTRVWVRSAVPNVAGSSFTIHLNKAVTASTKVAWFIVN